MNSTIFIRIYKVHYSDVPVFQTLSINLKVCGKFTIENTREECDDKDPSLLHLHITVRFHRLEDALDAINRYNNTRFMNRYIMKVAFYRPSAKQNRDRSQEIEYQKTHRISSKDRTISHSINREEKVIDRKRSPPLIRSPQRQRRRPSSSSSDTSTSSSSSNNGSSSKDLRSRLSTVPSKPSALPRRSEHTSRSRSRYSYREKVKQAVKRRVRVASKSSSSETSTTPVTSGTDSSPTTTIDNHVRKISIIPDEFDKNKNDVVLPISEMPVKTKSTTISEKKTEKETKKVIISPIKFGHDPITNQKIKFQEARKLVVAKSRKDSRRIVSIKTDHQTLLSSGISGQKLPLKMDHQEMNSGGTASLNLTQAENNEKVLDQTDEKKAKIDLDGLPVNPKEILTLTETPSLPDNNIDVPNQTRKIQFNIKNTSSFVKDKMIPNPLDSNKHPQLPDNINSNPEIITSKRKRNKSEFTPSFKSKIPATSSSLSRKNIQKQRLYKSKSFQSYGVADGYSPVTLDQHESMELPEFRPDITSLVSKRFVNFYQKTLINSSTCEVTGSAVQQKSNDLPLKTDASKDTSVKGNGADFIPPLTTVEEEENDNVASGHRSLDLQQIGNDSESQITDRASINGSFDAVLQQSGPSPKIHPDFEIRRELTNVLRFNPEENKSSNHCHDTTNPTESEDLDQSVLSDNLSTTSISFNEEISTPLVEVTPCVDLKQSVLSTSDDVQSIKPSVPTAVSCKNMTKDTGSPPETTSCFNHSPFKSIPENPEILQNTSCNKPVSSSPPVNTPPKCESLELSKSQDVLKESSIQNLCCNYVVDPSVPIPGSDFDLTDTTMDAASKYGSKHNSETGVPHIEPLSPSYMFRSDTTLQQMDTCSIESIESANALKRPISEDIDHSERNINIKQSTNPAKRQKQDDGYVCTLVKPHQMSFLLGEKEKLEKLYNEECRTVCNVVQLLVSQDPSLEKHVEKSLSQTLENIGEKYVSKLQETVIELSEMET